MPTPPNTTSGTARVITALPYTFTETVSDQANTLVLWYTYTAIENDRVLGITPFADIASNYEPTIRVYSSDATTIYKGISAAKQRSVAIPVTAGEQYYFRVIQGAVGTPLGADLVFTVIRAPQLDTPTGAVISTQDEANRRKAPILSTLSQQVYQYIDDFDFMEAANGSFLADGTMIGDGSPTNTIQIWTQSPLALVYDGLPSYSVDLPRNFSSNGTSLFYLLYQNASDPCILRTITPTGGETATTWTLPANSTSVSVQGIAINAAGTIAYYTGGTTSAIRAYDLVNNTALSDLAATLGAGWSPHQNLVVLQDDTILAGYSHPGATINYKLKRYATNGTVLNTYDMGANPLHHFAPGLSAANFYVWVHDATVSNNRSIYSNIKTSDGTTISSATYDNFNVGIDQMPYDPNYPDNDGPSFGPADTCTFFIVRVAITANPAQILPAFTTIRDPIRRQRTAPHLTDGTNRNRLFYPGAQLLFEPGGPRDDVGPLYFDLEWSDNGGATWSNIHRISAGELGQYGWRAIWRRLGTGRDRVFRVTESNAAKIVWTDFLLDPDPESGVS